MKKLYYVMVSALAWAGLILAGCSEIDPANTAVEAGRQYTLTVKATKGGIATKGFSYEESDSRLTKKLQSLWRENDELKVYDNEALSGAPLATLTATTISNDGLEAQFSGPMDGDALQGINKLWLVYKDNNYANQKGTLATLTEYSVAETGITSVSEGNYVIETNKTQFVSQQAVMMFKFENENEGLIDAKTIDIFYVTNTDEQKKFSVAIDMTGKAQGDPNEVFLGIPQCKSVSLLVTDKDGREYNYTKSDDGGLLNNGYFYPVAVRMHGEPILGDPYYSDGSWGCNAHGNGAEVVGIVVYLGSGDIVENKAHGLVMALKDASQSAKWDTYSKQSGNRVSRFNDKVTSAELALVNYGGKAKTEALSAYDNHQAAKLALEYNVSVNPNTCTGWFLPSSGQWISVIYGLCGAAYPVKDASVGGAGYDTWWLNGDNSAKKYWGTTATDIARVLYHPADGERYAHERINDALSAACGGDGSKYDEIITVIGTNNWISYWTSSESSLNEATRMNFGIEKDDERTKLNLRYSSIKADKKDKSTSYRVRAFLAF